MNREDEIQELCRQVKDLALEYDDHSYDFLCPLCRKSVCASTHDNDDIDKVTHDLGCGYLIAKDLSTKTTRRSDNNRLSGSANASPKSCSNCDNINDCEYGYDNRADGVCRNYTPT